MIIQTVKKYIVSKAWVEKVRFACLMVGAKLVVSNWVKHVTLLVLHFFTVGEVSAGNDSRGR
jgi:hypothetical protein